MKIRLIASMQVGAQLINFALCQQSGPAGDVVAYNFSHFSGTINFKSVVNFDFALSGCKMQDATVKSPIAPLDQGLTAVFRGPIRLKEFAVYNLQDSSPASQKATRKATRTGKNGSRQRRNAHILAHEQLQRNRGLGRRNCNDSVTATIDGQVVSFLDSWNCPSAVTMSIEDYATVAEEAVAASKPSTERIGAHGSQVPTTVDAMASAEPSKKPPSLEDDQPGAGDWRRVAYYSSTSPQDAYNVTFLYPVAYSHTDFLPSSGKMDGPPATMPQLLTDVLIPDNKRFYLTSNTPMQQNAAPDNKAYQGFRGSKIILIELGMPLSGLRDSSDYPDQPAFWLLNEQLPNTDDSSQCSCWASGCGEFDIHEILQPGALVGYSSLHMGQQYCGGADNGFERPVEGTLKLAVILKAGRSSSDSIVRIVRLQKSYHFDETVVASDLGSWIDIPITEGSEGGLRFGDSCPDLSSIHFRRRDKNCS